MNFKAWLQQRIPTRSKKSSTQLLVNKLQPRIAHSHLLCTTVQYRNTFSTISRPFLFWFLIIYNIKSNRKLFSYMCRLKVLICDLGYSQDFSLYRFRLSSLNIEVSISISNGGPNIEWTVGTSSVTPVHQWADQNQLPQEGSLCPGVNLLIYTPAASCHLRNPDYHDRKRH